MDYFKTLNRKGTASSKWDGAKHTFEHNDYLVFSVADSDYETAPAIKEALKKRVEHGAFGYTMLDDEYYTIIIKWFKRRYQCTIMRPWIVTSPKVLTALSRLISVLTADDTPITIQTPVYNMFSKVIALNHRPIIENPLTYKNQQYTIDFAHLERMFKKGVKMFLLCNPHNPVGRVWSFDELEKIVLLCKQYDIILVSDEIHADLIMPGYTFTSIGHFFKAYEHIIIVNAPSKTFNLAGLHTANMVIPSNRLRSLMKKAYQKDFINYPNALAITAVKAAYTTCDDWLEAQNAHIANNYALFKSFFLNHYANAVVLPLEGTYLAWVDLGYLGESGHTIVKRLKAFGIGVAAGEDYGSQSNGFIRFNLACSKNQLEMGLERLHNGLSSF